MNIRPDQLQTLNRLSSALGLSRSDLVRMILDGGIIAAEDITKEEPIGRTHG